MVLVSLFVVAISLFVYEGMQEEEEVESESTPMSQKLTALKVKCELDVGSLTKIYLDYCIRYGFGNADVSQALHRMHQGKQHNTQQGSNDTKSHQVATEKAQFTRTRVPTLVLPRALPNWMVQQIMFR
jgi:hypothetical protein